MKKNNENALPVVILNMHYSGLGIARSLKKIEVPIYGLSSDSSFPGNFSKNCKFKKIPDYHNNDQALNNYLINFSKTMKFNPIILPTCDHDIFFLEKYRKELERYFIIVQPTGRKLNDVMDKNKVFSIAKLVEVACPQTFTICSREDLILLKRKLKFPCIVKPLFSSHWRVKEVWRIVKNKAIVYNSFDDILDLYNKLSSFNMPLLIQDFIPGSDTNIVVFCAYRDKKGNINNYFTARKRILFPPRCGPGIIFESENIPEIIGMSKRLIEKLEIDGIIEIEYKYNQADGKFYLIELNPRFFDEHYIGSAVGVNLAESLYSDITKNEYCITHQKRKSVIWIADKDFIFMLIRNIFKREYPIKLIIKELKKKKIFATIDVTDPIPALFLLKNLFEELLTMLFKKLVFSLQQTIIYRKSEVK